MPDIDEPTISYSLREVLTRLESKIDRLVDAIGLKADRTEVIELDRRIGGVEARVTDLEHQRRAQVEHEKQRTEHRRWLWPTVFAFFAALGAFLGGLAVFHH